MAFITQGGVAEAHGHEVTLEDLRPRIQTQRISDIGTSLHVSNEAISRLTEKEARMNGRKERRKLRKHRLTSKSTQTCQAQGSSSSTSLEIPPIQSSDTRTQGKNKKGGRPKKPWIPSRDRLFTRFVTSTTANLTLLEHMVFEDGFKVSLKHLQDKVRDMFGPRAPGHPLYDELLRPRDIVDMDQRISAFMRCKTRWHYLASHGLVTGAQLGLDAHLPHIDTPRSNVQLELSIIAQNSTVPNWQQLLDARPWIQDQDKEPTFPDPPTSSQPFYLQDAANNSSPSLYSFGSSSSSLKFDNISIGSSSQGTYSSSGSQSSFQVPFTVTFPRSIPKVSSIKRYLKFRQGLASPSALSTLSLDEASQTLRRHGFDSTSAEENLYRVCFALSSTLSALPAEAARIPDLKKEIVQQRLKKIEFRRQAAWRLADIESRMNLPHSQANWPPFPEDFFGVDLESLDRGLYPCGFCLAKNCYADCISLTGSPPQNQLSDMATPLHLLASSAPNLEALMLEIARTESLHQRNSFQETFLHVLDPRALLFEPDHFLTFISCLAEQKFEFEAVDHRGWNTLLRIVSHPSWASNPTFSDPLQLGAEVILLIRAIDIACYKGNQFEMLRFRGFNGANLFGHLCRLAISAATPKRVKHILSSFIQVHCGEAMIYDDFGSSVLHRAVGMGDLRLVENIIKLGIDPWEENTLGMDAAVYGWGFLEIYHDDKWRYADVWTCMQRVIYRQQEVRANTGVHGSLKL